MWNVCVRTLANTRGYVGVDIGWNIWLFIFLGFFFCLNWALRLYEIWEERIPVWPTCGQLSFPFVIQQFPQTKEEERAVPEDPGGEGPVPTPDMPLP